MCVCRMDIEGFLLRTMESRRRWASRTEMTEQFCIYNFEIGNNNNNAIRDTQHIRRWWLSHGLTPSYSNYGFYSSFCLKYINLSIIIIIISANCGESLTRWPSQSLNCRSDHFASSSSSSQHEWMVGHGFPHTHWGVGGFSWVFWIATAEQLN